MSRLFIARHGDTFAPGEPPRRIGARTDLPLVASGLAQAEALARWFADRSIRLDHAFAGPLQRSRQTALTIIAGHMRPACLAVADWLDEIDHGPDEGAPEAAVTDRIGPDALAAWERDATPPPGWIVDAPHRLAAWRALLGQPPAGDSLLVTSNGAARFARLASPSLASASSLKLRTGAFGVIVVQRGSAPRLACWDVRPDRAGQ